MNSMGRDGLWMSTAVMTSFFVCVQFFFFRVGCCCVPILFLGRFASLGFFHTARVQGIFAVSTHAVGG